MWPKSRALRLLALVAGVLPAAVSAAELSSELPPDVPPARLAEGWERIDGHADTRDQRIDYALYVDPRYQALYVLTRYRISRITAGSDGGRVVRRESEKLLWNSHPGSREPLLAYELDPATADRGPRWRTLATGSDAYREVLMTAIGLYNHHSRRLSDAAR